MLIRSLIEIPQVVVNPCNEFPVFALLSSGKKLHYSGKKSEQTRLCNHDDDGDDEVCRDQEFSPSRCRSKRSREFIRKLRRES